MGADLLYEHIMKPSRDSCSMYCKWNILFEKGRSNLGANLSESEEEVEEEEMSPKVLFLKFSDHT